MTNVSGDNYRRDPGTGDIDSMIHHRNDDEMVTVSCDTAVIHWVFQDQVTHVTNESRGGPHQAGQSRPPGSGNSRGLFSSLIAQSSLVSQFTMLPSVTSLSLMTTLVFLMRVYITLGATLPYSLILPTETKCKEYSKSIAPSIAQNTNGEFQCCLKCIIAD